MPFLRFSRDKRGYENFYLIQPTNRRGKMPRLLYWFRTPPNVKVGRQPFDSEIRRALEIQNPDITFDWTAISETPIPPVVDTERWRERRRLERASRHGAAAVEEEAEPPLEQRRADADPFVAEQAIAEPFSAVEAVVPSSDDSRALDSGAIASVALVVETATPAAVGPVIDASPVESGRPQPGRRRRRRRGRRGARPPVSGLATEGTAVGEPGPADNPGVQDSGESGDDAGNP